MAIKAYRIKASTLRKIANAIRKVRGIDRKIPTSELANAYLGKTITITAPEGAAEEHIIYEETLVELADAIRSKDGTTAKILISDLEARILNSIEIKKLAKPIIRLVEGEEDSPDGLTPAILGIAILGRTILGKTTVSNLPRLAKPSIRLVEIADGVIQLDKPKISLVEVAEMLQLSKPYIELIEVSDELPEEPDVPDEPEMTQLSKPIIALVIIGEDEPVVPDEPEIEQLAQPIITLVIEEDEEPEPDIPEEPELKQLDKPQIELVEVLPEEPTITQLDKPDIYLETIDDSIVVFDQTVTPIADTIVFNGSSLGGAPIISNTHFLDEKIQEYTVTLNGNDVRKVSKSTGMSAWSHGQISDDDFMLLIQGEEGKVAMLGINVDEEIHIKISYEEEVEDGIVVFNEIVYTRNDETYTQHSGNVVEDVTTLSDETLLDEAIDVYTLSIDGVEYELSGANISDIWVNIEKGLMLLIDENGRTGIFGIENIGRFHIKITHS